MEEYVSNSKKSKEAQKTVEKRVEKVINGDAKPKKRSELRKFTDIFIAEDISNVKSYIVTDVIVPAIKDAIEDVVHMLLRGGSADRNRKGVPASKVSYRSYYEKERSRSDRNEPRPRTGYNYDEYTLEHRGDAEDVLTRMNDVIEMYGAVSIADYYDLIGVSGNYTDYKYGWTSVRNAQVVRTRDGEYTIKFPRPMPLD